MSPESYSMRISICQGRYYAKFKAPDVYGVFQFILEYRRPGYTNVILKEQVCVLLAHRYH